MPNKFEEKESYTHKFAKELLSNWLISYSFGPRLKIIDQNEEEHQLWGDWNIQTEYPITKTFPYYLDEYPCCDEEEKLIDNIKGRSTHKGCQYRGNQLPSKCLECKHFMKKEKLLAVADIVCLHEGTIIEVFEIEHKNPLSPEKITIYEKYKTNGNVWEIQAQHILGQIKKPQVLHAKLVIE